MKKNIFKILRSLVFICSGVISFIACFSVHCSVGWVSYENYGGDAYTGIQNAAADTANNIWDLTYFLMDSARFFFVIVGVLLLGLGIIGLIEAIVEGRKKVSDLPVNNLTITNESSDNMIRES